MIKKIKNKHKKTKNKQTKNMVKGEGRKYQSWCGEVLHKLCLMLSELLKKNTILDTTYMGETEGNGRLLCQQKDDETMKVAETSYKRTHSGAVQSHSAAQGELSVTQNHY